MSLMLLNPEEVERPRDIPDAPAKPDWKVALKRAASKFGTDGCSDLAAALTYRSMQALFPGLIAVLSLLNLFGNGKQTAQDVIDKLAAVVGKNPNDSSLSGIKTFVENITTQGGGGIAFVIGVLLALNSASGYIAAFSKAANTMYAVPEGRSTISLKLSLLVVTIIEVIMILLVIFAIVTTGSVAQQLGSTIGLGDTAVTVWDWVKWPFVVFLVVLIIGMLFWAAPNVKKTKKDIFTWGALIGFVVWVLASAALAIYITLSHGASYQKTYGIFANAIIFLLWLWITNMAILFGAEVDAELLRTRQLKSGLPAEELILLPPKSDVQFAKLDRKAADTLDEAHELRLSAMKEAAGDPNSFGRASMAAGYAALVAGEGSTSRRDDSSGLVGPRDATAPRPGGHALLTERDRKAGSTVSSYSPDSDPAITEARLLRRDAALLKAQKSRRVRDRLDRQEAKAAKRVKEREKKAEEARKVAESHIGREERWAAVERVRSQYEPQETVARDTAHAERSARRAQFRVEQQEKQAEAASQARVEKIKAEEEAVADAGSGGSSAMPTVAKAPMPSELRDQVVQEQDDRRARWFAEHPPRPGR